MSCQSCEKIRLALENCEVEKDIATFIRERGTGQEIPDAPKYINFCRGDVDAQSDTSEEDSYSVAQFQRTINPAFRTSSPQPSTYESHDEPQPNLAVETPRHDPYTPPSRERTMTPQKALASKAPPPQMNYQAHPASQIGIQHGQHEQLPTVPHNAYPMDGMTMYCRTAPPSDRSSAASPGRPISRDSQSEYSNPTSFSSFEPPSGKQSPTKQVPAPVAAENSFDKQVQKKKSGFFQNHSPFRRKSKHERENRLAESSSSVMTPSANRGTGFSSSVTRTGGAGRDARPTMIRGVSEGQSMLLGNERPSHSPEPADPRANFQLNVGNNVFDVASPDGQPSSMAAAQKNQAQDDLDPIAQALAELKGVGKPSAVRMSADRYHGLQTPAPSTSGGSSATLPSSEPPASTRRTTPPPSYDQPVRRLDLPQPAFTAAQMQKTRQKYLEQRHSVFGDGKPTSSSASTTPTRPGASDSRIQARPVTRGGSGGGDVHDAVPRATSPLPRRSVSPRPAPYREDRQGYRSMSPNPYARGPAGRPQSKSLSPQKRDSDQGYFPKASPQADPRRRGSADVSANTQLQLAPAPESSYDMQYARPAQGSNDRPMSYYGGSTTGGSGSRDSYAAQRQVMPASDTRLRSRSVNGGQQFTGEGRPILHHCEYLLPPLSSSLSPSLPPSHSCSYPSNMPSSARAMYTYQAAIPEELSFAKGDVLAILRHQDDGWWEAEVVSKKGRPGLVPSNYLKEI